MNLSSFLSLAILYFKVIFKLLKGRGGPTMRVPSSAITSGCASQGQFLPLVGFGFVNHLKKKGLSYTTFHFSYKNENMLKIKEIEKKLAERRERKHT